jgi:hypothetical protein
LSALPAGDRALDIAELFERLNRPLRADADATRKSIRHITHQRQPVDDLLQGPTP